MPPSDARYYWDLSSVAFSLLPLFPGLRRKTLLQEVSPNKIWTLDQVQGVINVNVPVRAVVVKLAAGGLLVYNPVAPTAECIEMVRRLEKEHGPVKFILLATLGLEHKAFFGPFCRNFPNAEVYAQAGQWSFPFNLPNAFVGFPVHTKDLPTNIDEAPWKEDFDQAVLGPLRFKSVGGFGETALYHRSTKTLLVTDTVVLVADRPAAILEEDPRALLYHSRDSQADPVVDTEEARLKGWRRMALFGLTFFPSGIEVKDLVEAVLQLPSLPRESHLLGQGAVPIDGGLYLWKWKTSELSSFQALQGGLLVAPILRSLILNREPEVVLAWADQISSWAIERIIPAHLENNIAANGEDFRRAFAFLRGEKEQSKKELDKKIVDIATPFWSWQTNFRKASMIKSDITALPLPEDMKLLNGLSDLFTKWGVVAPPAGL